MQLRLSRRNRYSLVVILIGIAAFLGIRFYHSQNQNIGEDEGIPSPTQALLEEAAAEPKTASALGGYDVLIADRGNNRIIEVTPDKKIVWEYKFNLPVLGYGADDAFFINGGKQIIANLENYQEIQIIDYATKQVIWQYGHPGMRGSGDGYLNNPDDAYLLPNGNVIVADIKNCRVIEISRDKKIVNQYGRTGVCKNTDGYLNKPNGDTPLPDGHILVSNIVGHNLIELDQNWRPVFSMAFPLVYPSDPQMTKAGNILISEYMNPGKVLEISKTGAPVWEFTAVGQGGLNKPSLAIELPNGNILSNDDYNHRVIVIDKATKKIVWQYGVTGKPGNAAGQLSVPDGLDIIRRDAAPVIDVGQVTRHAADFVGRDVAVSGYLLKKESGYIIISDEKNGSLSRYDLPVTGPGISSLIDGTKYIFRGKFVDSGLTVSNGNPDHLELSALPEAQ